MMELGRPLPLRVIDSIPLASAFLALAFPHFADVCVCGIVGVLLRAVNFRTSGATAMVLFVGDWFQMGGINAQRRLTQMIQVQAFRDSADEVLVHQSVRSVGLLPPSTFAITLTGRANPDPAVAGLSIGNKFIQQLFNRLRIERHSGKPTFLDVGRGTFAASLAHPFNHEQ